MWAGVSAVTLRLNLTWVTQPRSEPRTAEIL